MIPEHILEEQLRQRIRRAGHSLDETEDLASFGARLRAAESRDAPELFVIIQDFDLTVFLQGTLRALHQLDAGTLQTWYRQFTKTHFLAGRPTNLLDVAWHHVSPDGSVGWALLDGHKPKMRLLRLLKRLTTARPPELPDEVHLPGAPRGAQAVARIAVSGLSLETYLIHLNHLICDAFIEGALSAHDALRLCNIPRIDAWPIRPDAVRVHGAIEAPATLRVYGDLMRSNT